MIYPIGDTQVKIGHPPYLSRFFLVLNILIFFYEVSLGEGVNELFMNFGAVPNEITQGKQLYTLITNMFLHGGWMHLIGNMLFLWIFGDNIEATIGSMNFLYFYFIGGLIASMSHVLVDMNSTIPAVGASGAIAAIMGAYMIMFPKNEIKMVFIIFFKTFKVPALLFLGLWFLENIISGLGVFSLSGNEAGGGTAWWAHIGGFIFGLAAGKWFKYDYMQIPPSRAKYVEKNNTLVR